MGPCSGWALRPSHSLPWPRAGPECILAMQSPGVGVKTGRSRVGGPKLCVWGSKVTRDKGGTMFTQVRALLMEVKPYVLLDYS